MKNLIITGGELFNKGAQAMIYITVDECKKRFPDHAIYVLSEMDLRRPKEELSQYAFNFTGWYTVKFARAQSNPVLHLVYKLRHKDELKECEELYKNCDLMIDISGYGLGSTFGINQITTYVEHLEYSKAFHIPYYLMPQSFGPFDFSKEQMKITKHIDKLLRLVKVICAREQEGYEGLIKEYRLDNVRLLPDVVLNNKGISLTNIYKEIPQFRLPHIYKNSVAFIPNERIAQKLGMSETIGFYNSLILALLEMGKSVYIISHATSDRQLCSAIMQSLDKEEVYFLDQEFTCLEFNEIVKQFRIVVSSRFHAIVYAYKNGIPSIAIGWAVKYKNLLESFDESRFVFDIGENLSTDHIINEIKYLDNHVDEEKDRIKRHLEDIQCKNVFDIIEE